MYKEWMEFFWGKHLLLAHLKVDDEENDTQDNADGAHHQVGNSQERILAPQPWSGCEGDFLGTIKVHYREGCKQTAMKQNAFRK